MKRINTHIRIPEELYKELKREANDRDVSANYLMVKAIEKFIRELDPPWLEFEK